MEVLVPLYPQTRPGCVLLTEEKISCFRHVCVSSSMQYAILSVYLVRKAHVS